MECARTVSLTVGDKPRPPAVGLVWLLPLIPQSAAFAVCEGVAGC